MNFKSAAAARAQRARRCTDRIRLADLRCAAEKRLFRSWHLLRACDLGKQMSEPER